MYRDANQGATDKATDGGLGGTKPTDKATDAFPAPRAGNVRSLFIRRFICCPG